MSAVLNPRPKIVPGEIVAEGVSKSYGAPQFRKETWSGRARC